MWMNQQEFDLIHTGIEHDQIQRNYWKWFTRIYCDKTKKQIWKYN